MISTIFIAPHEMAEYIARQAQAKRLSHDLSQKTLSERAGVSLGVLKKFESTGKISLESLLKLALVLESMDEFKTLFRSAPLESSPSLDELLKDKTRKRGRR